MPILHSIQIKIDGQDQTSNLQNDLVEVIVDTTLSLPGSFSILVTNGILAHDKDFEIGKAVEIGFQPAQASSSSSAISLITGMITAIEPIFAANGTQLLRVRGYEKTIKLTQGKKTRTFLSQTYSDIISRIAGENGLSVEVESTSITYPHIIQYNQSDWDFLLSLARKSGFLVWTSDGKVNFKHPVEGKSVDLVWPDDLINFEPRMTFLGQIAKSNASGWDTKQKQAIIGTASSGNVQKYRSIGFTTTGQSMVSTDVSANVAETVIDLSMVSTQEANTKAQAQIDLTEAGFVAAEGECLGNPNLAAGCTANIKGVSTKFSGKYLVTQARHEYVDSKYTTYFSVNGAAPETIFSLLLPKDRDYENRIDGVVTAVVTQISDPDKAAKVKVKYPWLKDMSDTEVESNWARLAVIGGGKNRGIGFVPEIDDEVLVAFADGDINAPYVIGALWNSKDTALTGMVDNGKVVQRTIRSRSGHIIILDDTEGSESITIKDKTEKNSIVIKSSDNSMTIQSEGDLTLEAKGKLIMKSTKDASLESSTGKTEIKGSTELAMSSMQKASLTAASVSKIDLQASGAKLEGINVEITGQAKASVKGTAMVEVQGALVKIN